MGLLSQVNAAPARAVYPHPQAGAARKPVRFAGSADQYGSKKKYILIPSGTPIFFLHGTSNNGKKLNPLIYWFKRDVRTTHPGYVSYSPEVQWATGIERVENPLKTTPAYLAALRDIGDFRLQTTHLRLEEMQKQFGQLSGDWTNVPDKAVGDYFHIRPIDRDWLAPIVKRELLPMLLTVPKGWGHIYARPLGGILNQGLEKLHAELAKLRLRPDEKNLPVFDTDFLNAKALYEGKTTNFDMERPDPDQETINIRSIPPRILAEMESYLLMMEERLGNALMADMPKRLLESEPGRLKRARTIAGKLMESIAPRMVTIGHSQGGTTLHSALVNYVLNAPDSVRDLQHAMPESNFRSQAYQVLPGRAIGMEVGLSAPLRGIPDMPLWGKKLVARLEKLVEFLPQKHRDFIMRQVHAVGWHLNERGAPAIEEMRADSELMKKFQDNVPTLAGRNVTVISAFDKDDSYVEPAASRLFDAEGKAPENVFNVELESEELPSGFTTPDDLVSLIINTFPVTGPWMIKLMPRAIKKYAHSVYNNDLVSMEHHRSLVTLPNKMSNQIGRKLMETPEAQAAVLGPDNFEAFRYQSIIARARSLERKIENQPLARAAQVLHEFHQNNPHFMERLIANAKEDLPTTNAASYEANELLERTVQLMTQVHGDPKLSARYAPHMRKALRQIVTANLPAFKPDSASVSEQAAELLKSMR